MEEVLFRTVRTKGFLLLSLLAFGFSLIASSWGLWGLLGGSGLEQDWGLRLALAGLFALLIQGSLLVAAWHLRRSPGTGAATFLGVVLLALALSASTVSGTGFWHRMVAASTVEHDLWRVWASDMDGTLVAEESRIEQAGAKLQESQAVANALAERELIRGGTCGTDSGSGPGPRHNFWIESAGDLGASAGMVERLHRSGARFRAVLHEIPGIQEHGVRLTRADGLRNDVGQWLALIERETSKIAHLVLAQPNLLCRDERIETLVAQAHELVVEAAAAPLPQPANGFDASDQSHVVLRILEGLGGEIAYLMATPARADVSGAGARMTDAEWKALGIALAIDVFFLLVTFLGPQGPRYSELLHDADCAERAELLLPTAFRTVGQGMRRGPFRTYSVVRDPKESVGARFILHGMETAGLIEPPGWRLSQRLRDELCRGFPGNEEVLIFVVKNRFWDALREALRQQPHVAADTAAAQTADNIRALRVKRDIS